jgi:hypothetical protein
MPDRNAAPLGSDSRARTVAVFASRAIAAVAAVPPETTIGPAVPGHEISPTQTSQSSVHCAEQPDGTGTAADVPIGYQLSLGAARDADASSGFPLLCEELQATARAITARKGFIADPRFVASVCRTAFRPRSRD